jgi:arylsulfatase A-like enzyme
MIRKLYTARLRARLALAAALVAASAAPFVVSCSRGPSPNILLITVDTLRPDHLGYGGGRHGVSPTVDAVARTGMVYRNAYSVSGWTMPSIATILTGLYPRQHGMVSWKSVLSESLTTMAEVLHDRGYDTGAFVSHLVFRKERGLAAGFDTYDATVLDVGHPHKVSTAYELTKRAIAFIEQAHEPYFVWIHYFDPHFDYLVHEHFRSFGTRPVDRYDQEVAAVDREIDRLIRAIHARGEIDNTAIIFTSDHGEEFGERGGRYHRTLYDEILRVPLLVRAPGHPVGEDDRPVEQIDLLPTVYGLLGMAADELPGHDLLSPRYEGERVIYAERQFPPLWAQQSVRNDRYKLTIVEEVDTTRIDEDMIEGLPKVRAEVRNVIPGIYLFDLAADPEERNNIYSDDNDEGRALLAALLEYMESTAVVVSPEIEMDEDTIDKLRSLGYIQ